MGLVQAELERQGIASVSISLLKEVTKKLQSPRSLFVPFAHGFPLGEPKNSGLQQDILRRMFDIVQLKDCEIPYIEHY
jgi:hypothetical protein